MKITKFILLTVGVTCLNQLHGANQISTANKFTVGKVTPPRGSTSGFAWGRGSSITTSPLGATTTATYTQESHSMITSPVAAAAPAPITSPSDTNAILVGSPTAQPDAAATTPTSTELTRAKSPVADQTPPTESGDSKSATSEARDRSHSFTESTQVAAALATATTKTFDVRTRRSGYNPGVAKNMGLAACDFPTVLAAAQKGEDAFKALDPRQVERALGEAFQYANHSKFPATGVAEIIKMVRDTGTEINRKYFGDAYGVLEADIKIRLESEHARIVENLNTIRKLKLAKLDCQVQAEIQGGTGCQSPIEEYGNTETADSFLIAADKIRAVAMPQESTRTQTATQNGSAFIRVTGGHLTLLPAANKVD